jgi:hypothetical protein
MVPWRILASLALTLAFTGSLRAQTYELAEAPQAGRYFDVQLAMDLSAELRVRKDDKVAKINERATARHHYRERVLEAAAEGPAAKAARLYEEARVSIAVGDDRSDCTLRPERCLLVAHRTKEQLVTYCPKGPLTRQELELAQHLDVLALPGLLPGKKVSRGETWKVSNAVAQALCHFDGLTGQDLEGRLDDIKDKVAFFSVKGTANGIDTGAAVKTTVQASGEFDLGTRRLVSVTWKQTDEREQGPASPAMGLSMNVTVQRAPMEPVPELHDYALIGVVPEGQVPPDAATALAYADPKGRFTMVYARDWQLVAHTDDFMVLRLLARGDFVAQATITPLRPAAPGKSFSDEEFKELVNATPGWEPDGDTKVEEVSASGGITIRRLAVQGQLDGLKTAQYCYLLTNSQGEQLVVAFTMTPSQVAALETRDLVLVRGISLRTGGRQGE